MSALDKNYSISLQTALEIAKKGGTIHMICRNPKYAQDAQKEIQDVSKNNNIYAHIVNIADPKAVLWFSTRLYISG